MLSAVPAVTRRLPKRPHRRPGRRPRARAAVAALAWWLCLAAAPPAAAQSQGEAALKLRITLALARFVQWPDGTPDVLRLCLAQRDPAIAMAFAEADGQLINGRRIQIVRTPPLSDCRLLFVHASAERSAELLRAASAGSTLTIGDAEGTLAHGGMVELVEVNDAIRFDVGMGALRQSQLGLSSQALRLARQVRP